MVLVAHPILPQFLQKGVLKQNLSSSSSSSLLIQFCLAFVVLNHRIRHSIRLKNLDSQHHGQSSPCLCNILNRCRKIRLRRVVDDIFYTSFAQTVKFASWWFCNKNFPSCKANIILIEARVYSLSLWLRINLFSFDEFVDENQHPSE